ncbi:hypothetical protein J6590_039186 [Homalodisca vitripennis]|nr:hypothetical protein J6590_039186 [Homalodisca vitripennis]
MAERLSAGTNLSVTVPLFIGTIYFVLYRSVPLFCLIGSSHRPVAHEDGQRRAVKGVGLSLKKVSKLTKTKSMVGWTTHMTKTKALRAKFDDTIDVIVDVLEKRNRLVDYNNKDQWKKRKSSTRADCKAVSSWGYYSLSRTEDKVYGS